jgi:UDP-GlcNAc:undecaprenyl-phosphate GlcNAc-1-phosphate transferase
MFNSMAASATGIVQFVSLLACLLILLNARVIGERLDIMDHPDTVRKRHARITPLVGGLAIMLPLFIWAGGLLLWGQSSDPRFVLAVMLCGGGATLVGYADDQSATSPSSRLLSLILLSAMALVIDPQLIPVQLNWGSFAPTSLPEWIACTFIMVAMAGYVNSVNMADGQNGIVTGMYAIWAGCLLIATAGATAGLALVLLEVVIVTFLFNMAGRTFLGDSGTYGVTFVIGLLAINAHNRFGVSAETITVWFFIPVMDCIRLMVSRALQGQAPSDADRDHFHHRLQDRVGKNYGLVIYLGAGGVSSLLVTLLPHSALVCMVVLAAFYFSFAWLTEADSEVVHSDDLGGDEASRLDASNVVRFGGSDSAERK